MFVVKKKRTTSREVHPSEHAGEVTTTVLRKVTTKWESMILHSLLKN